MADRCGVCGEHEQWSAPVSVILLFAPGLATPYPLIADAEYRLCATGKCDSDQNFVTRAQASHPAVRDAGAWSAATILFVTGRGVMVRRKAAGLLGAEPVTATA